MKNKKWIGLIVAVLLCILAIPAMGLAEGTTVEVSNLETLQSEISSATSSTNVKTIKVMQDIDWTDTIEVAANHYVILDLNGHVFDAKGEDVSIHNKGNLTIIDSNKDNPKHYFKVKSNGLWELTDQQSSVRFEDLKVRPEEGTVIEISGGIVTGVDGSQTGHMGSAIYNDLGGVLYLNGGAYVGNNNYIGGAVDNVETASLTMEGATIAGNLSVTGGGMMSDGTFNLKSGVIFGNTASYHGGGLECCGITTITGGKISANKATETGGGIFHRFQHESYNLQLTITDVEISNNIAEIEGGGICMSYPQSECDVKITGGTITNNVAPKSAGIGVNSWVISEEEAKELYKNYYILVGGTVQIQSNNISYGEHLPSNLDLRYFSIKLSSDNQLSKGANIGITNSDDNKVFATGAKDGDEEYFTSDNANKVIYYQNDGENGTLKTRNVDTYHVYRQENENIGEGKYSIGTALSLVQKGDTIKVEEDLDLSKTIQVNANQDFMLDLNGYVLDAENVAKPGIGDSGAVITNKGILTIIDSTPERSHSGNYASLPKGGIITKGKGYLDEKISYDGGGVYNAGTLTLKGGTITINEANCGGGIYNAENATFTLEEKGTIKDNIAPAGCGIYNAGTMTMNGGTITENDFKKWDGTDGTGGGIYLASGTMVMNGGTISKNVARHGGGIYRHGGSLTVTDGSISGNTGGYCGGIDCCASKGDVILTGGEITGNIGQFKIGGIGAMGDPDTEAVEGKYIILGGDVKIQDNTTSSQSFDTHSSNLDWSEIKVVISAEKPLTDAQIGILAEESCDAGVRIKYGTFATGAKEADLNCFTSDYPYTKLKYDGQNQTLIAVPYYGITLNDSKGGSVVITDVETEEENLTAAESGHMIKVVATPSKHYELDEITVYKTENENWHYALDDNNQFEMPECDVTVNVVFKSKCPIHRFFRKVGDFFRNLFK